MLKSYCLISNFYSDRKKTDNISTNKILAMMTQYSPVTHTVNGSITDFFYEKKSYKVPGIWKYFCTLHVYYSD